MAVAPEETPAQDTTPQATVAAPPADPPPLDPGIRDTRRSRIHPRSRKLLLSEIQTLERLLRVTPARTPDHAKIARRLAEDYVELEAAATREPVAPSHRGDAAKLERIRRAAQQRAVKYYRLLQDELRDQCTTPGVGSARGAGCLDEVLYFLGYEYELAGRPDQARSTYLELVKRFPTSPFVPYAYFAFGEYYFREALSDPSKWEPAARLYEKAARFEGSTIAPYALHRLDLICERGAGSPGLPASCASGSPPPTLQVPSD